ncbi:hypothetical protein N9Y48_01435 [Zobellia sp.]|nr:hypothetical protein [Zobellia sp.]
MSLTKENIQFIDNYLKNTDIQYIDVRMELLDHVATAVENDMRENNRTFYYAFKEYMVFNKKQLEKDYERLRKDLQKKSFGILGRKMITPPFLVLFVVLFGLLYYWGQIFNFAFPYPHVIWGSYLLTAFTFFVSTLPKRYNRLSSLEMLVWPIFFGMYLVNFFVNFSYHQEVLIPSMPLISITVTSLFLCANMAFLVLFFEKRKEVKRNYI